MTTEKKSLRERMEIKVNPHYDLDLPPEDQDFSYWNPVSATNDLLKLSNIAIELTQSASAAIRERLEVRVTRKQKIREIETIEKQLLVEEPPSPSEVKTSKLVEAAIDRRALAAGRAEPLDALRREVGSLEDRERMLDDKVDSLMLWIKINEKVCDNIKTALSFYKDERRHEHGA